jgi:hypothetical protein
MPQQDALQVCLNGHRITELYHWDESSRKAFCPYCEIKTPTIYQCPSCKREIPGNSLTELSAGAATLENVQVPNSCQYCGEPFPWTVKKNTPDYYQINYNLKEAAKKKAMLDEMLRIKLMGETINSAKQLYELEKTVVDVTASSEALPHYPPIQPVTHITHNTFNHSPVIQNSPYASQNMSFGNREEASTKPGIWKTVKEKGIGTAFELLLAWVKFKFGLK